jgi:hypothetical protein
VALTGDERCLLALYYSASREKTAERLREALPRIGDPDLSRAAKSAARKVETMGNRVFAGLLGEIDHV